MKYPSAADVVRVDRPETPRLAVNCSLDPDIVAMSGLILSLGLMDAA